MKNLLWFLFGVMGGFVAAHLMNKDPRGHEVLAEVDGRITEFTDRISDAYREQEARISGIADGVNNAATDAPGSAELAAGDVSENAGDAAPDTASDASDALAETASGAPDAPEDAASDAGDAGEAANRTHTPTD